MIDEEDIDKMIAAMLRAAVLAEREACAQIADEAAMPGCHCDGCQFSRSTAALIRARAVTEDLSHP